MAVHYCPECGAFSFHAPEGFTVWDVECPSCGHRAHQVPHPPPPAPARKKAPTKKKAPAKNPAPAQETGPAAEPAE